MPVAPSTNQNNRDVTQWGNPDDTQEDVDIHLKIGQLPPHSQPLQADSERGITYSAFEVMDGKVVGTVIVDNSPFASQRMNEVRWQIIRLQAQNAIGHGLRRDVHQYTMEPPETNEEAKAPGITNEPPLTI